MEDNLEQKTGASPIEEAMRAKNISLEKLCLQTGISERFVHALIEGKSGQMPSAPYVRGYCMRIGEALGVDGEALWKEYAAQPAAVPRAGMRSAPYPGRFFGKRVNAKTIGIGAVLAAVVLIGVFRSSAFVGKPTLTLESLGDLETVATSTYLAKGSIDPQNQLTINGEAVYPNEDGSFEKELALSPGFNTFRFGVKGLLGKELQITKQILYTTSTAASKPATTTNQ